MKKNWRDKWLIYSSELKQFNVTCCLKILTIWNRLKLTVTATRRRQQYIIFQRNPTIYYRSLGKNYIKEMRSHTKVWKHRRVWWNVVQHNRNAQQTKEEWLQDIHVTKQGVRKSIMSVNRQKKNPGEIKYETIGSNVSSQHITKSQNYSKMPTRNWNPSIWYITCPSIKPICSGEPNEQLLQTLVCKQNTFLLLMIIGLIPSLFM
jgi:hypothetical protein